MEAPTALSARVVALINIGVNDFSGALPDQTAWQNAMLSLIDRISYRWPDSAIYIMRPWARGFDTRADTMAGWIDNVIAARPTRAALGPDERVWLKGADDGATMTTDGTHYSAAGNAEVVEQWLTTLGY